jgi:hypothetical protein
MPCLLLMPGIPVERDQGSEDIGVVRMAVVRLLVSRFSHQQISSLFAGSYCLIFRTAPSGDWRW